VIDTTTPAGQLIHQMAKDLIDRRPGLPPTLGTGTEFHCSGQGVGVGIGNPLPEHRLLGRRLVIGDVVAGLRPQDVGDGGVDIVEGIERRN